MANANKVVINRPDGEDVLIDLTGDSVTTETVFEGETFHGSNGEQKTGTFTIAVEMSEQDSLIEQIKAALQGKLAGGGGGEPPENTKYKTELKYLESLGVQYIDTKIKGSNNLETTLTVQELQINKSSAGKGIFGTYNSPDSATYYLYQEGSSSPHWQVGLGYHANTSVFVDTEKHTFEFKNNKVYMDGTEIFSSNAGTFETNRSLLLFSMYKADGTLYDSMPKRIYKATFVRNGVLVGDFIPVLDWNDRPCMYDKVSGELFYNSGSGEFAYA